MMESIKRKTYEQIELERMWEVLEEMRGEMEHMRNDLRSYHSKVVAWDDLKSMMQEIRVREEVLQTKETVSFELHQLLRRLSELANRCTDEK